MGGSRVVSMGAAVNEVEATLMIDPDSVLTVTIDIYAVLT